MKNSNLLFFCLPHCREISCLFYHIFISLHFFIKKSGEKCRHPHPLFCIRLDVYPPHREAEDFVECICSAEDVHPSGRSTKSMSWRVSIRTAWTLSWRRTLSRRKSGCPRQSHLLCRPLRHSRVRTSFFEKKGGGLFLSPPCGKRWTYDIVETEKRISFALRYGAGKNKILKINNVKIFFVFFKHLLFFRDDRIRTCDTMLPKHMRYQAALHPVFIFNKR